MKRRKLEVTCVGVQDIESTIQFLKRKYQGKKIRISLYEFSIIENCFSLEVWEER